MEEHTPFQTMTPLFAIAYLVCSPSFAPVPQQAIQIQSPPKATRIYDHPAVLRKKEAGQGVSYNRIYRAWRRSLPSGTPDKLLLSEEYMPEQCPNPLPSKLIFNGIAFETVKHGAAFRMPRHSHDEAHMAFLCNGRIDNIQTGANSTVTKTELLFMPPGESHATCYSDSVHAFYVAFSQE